MSRKTSQNRFWMNHPRLLVGLMAAGLSVPALLGQSVPFPTYQVGPQSNGTFVASDGTILTPTGTQVNLGNRVRAKSIAVNPLGNSTAAVMVMGSRGPTARPSRSSTPRPAWSCRRSNLPAIRAAAAPASPTRRMASTCCSARTAKRARYGGVYQGFVGIASVNPATGLLSAYAHISVPMAIDATGKMTNVTCFSDTAKVMAGPPAKGISPPGTTGSFNIPCAYSYSLFSDETSTSYPMGIAVTSDASTAYVVLDNNDTLAKINLASRRPKSAKSAWATFRTAS